MKHTIYGIVMLAVMVLVLTVNLVISGKEVRKNELQKTLDLSVKQTVSEIADHPKRTETEQEYIALFMERFIQGLESDSELSVSILGADMEKGVLSVGAEEVFRHPGGGEGKVAADTTVVLEQYSLPKKQQYMVKYQVAGQVYKEYCLTEGSRHKVSKGTGEGFVYWCDERGEKQEEGTVITVTKDQIFRAVMEEKSQEGYPEGCVAECSARNR